MLRSMSLVQSLFLATAVLPWATPAWAQAEGETPAAAPAAADQSNIYATDPAPQEPEAAVTAPVPKAHYQGDSQFGLQLGYQQIDGSGAIAVGGRAGYYLMDDLMLGLDASYLYTTESNSDDFVTAEPLAKYLLVNRANYVVSGTVKGGHYFNLGDGKDGNTLGAGPGLEFYWGRSGYFIASFIYKKLFIDGESLTIYEIGAGLGF